MMCGVPKGYARYVLAVMVGINFLNYFDRWVGSAVAPLIQQEFQLSDFEVGLLGTAFLLVYSVAVVPFGYWADRGIRRTLIGIGVAIWSCATLVSGFAQSFVQLFLSRTLLGIGEASYYPTGTSLLGDYFPKETRGRAMSIWGAGSAVGIAAGFAGGGVMASHFGWRSAFFLAAIPGLLLALAAFTMREPLRGAAEKEGPRVAHAEAATPAAMLGLLRIPTLRWLALARVALFFVLAANAYWLPTALNRRFGMSVSQAGLLAGGVLVAGALVGTLAGGWIADWRRANHPDRAKAERANLHVGLAGFLVASISIAVAILSPFPLFLPAFFVTVVCLYLYSGPFDATVQNVVTPALRASAVTVTLVIAHLFGDSYAPAAIGLLSDLLHSLPLALLLTSTPLLLVAAVCSVVVLPSVAADTEAMEAAWAREGTSAPPAPAPPAG
jgi:MFS transporter, Spinster family, sphingosine-1-phosphate transporter